MGNEEGGGEGRFSSASPLDFKEETVLTIAKLSLDGLAPFSH